MSSHRSYETAALPRAVSQDWPKRLARRMDVPEQTARHWIYRQVPENRRAEIAAAIVGECDDLLADLAALRNGWAREAHEARRATRQHDAHATCSLFGEMGWAMNVFGRAAA